VWGNLNAWQFWMVFWVKWQIRVDIATHNYRNTASTCCGWCGNAMQLGLASCLFSGSIVFLRLIKQMQLTFGTVVTDDQHCITRMLRSHFLKAIVSGGISFRYTNTWRSGGFMEWPAGS
jgi:hypothetical protein